MTKTHERLGVIACSLALAFGAGAARAQDQDQDYRPHFGTVAVSVGGAAVMFSSNGKFTLAGHPLPGADLKLSDTGTATFEAQYFLRHDLSLALSVGIPPTITANGKGTLAPLGRLGNVQFGPGAGYLNYHFGGLGRIQPFVGVGVTRMLIFHESDGAITRLNVHPSWGAAFRAGADYMVTPHWGVYGNVSRLMLRSHGAGVFEGLPVTAKVALDPTIVHAGVTYRF
ncbi:MAG TPA: OmpW family outer membrane protein [Caulobacteraceae bacterium]|jgi:outer membrane protein